MIGTEPRFLLIFSANTRCDDLRNVLGRIVVVGLTAKTRIVVFLYGMSIYPYTVSSVFDWDQRTKICQYY